MMDKMISPRRSQSAIAKGKEISEQEEIEVGCQSIFLFPVA